MVSQGNPRGGITFHHQGWFWFGVTAVTIGVVLHLPPYLGAADMDYMMSGMAMGRGGNGFPDGRRRAPSREATR